MENQLLFEIALSLVEGVGPIKAKNLIRFCGSAENVFTEKKQLLLKVPEVGEKLVESIYKSQVFERAEKELEFCLEHNIRIISYRDKAYPRRLLQCPDHPVVLFYKGNGNLNESKMLSVVGTRRVTPQGRLICQDIIKGLSDQGVTIVSGLAYGVDVTAHRASIEHKLPTIGVLAHGLDRIYPRDHHEVAQRMVEDGGLLTEFISNTNPDKENFPTRNRIVAGMTDATLVVESQGKGGAMITANLAFDYNRDVLSIPGRPGDVFSEGCNKLIQSNRAALVQNSTDVLKALGWEESPRKKRLVQPSLLLDLNEEEQLITSAIRERGQVSLDELGVELKKPISELAIPLLELEMKGAIQSLPGKLYRSF